jgi:hypothetical protein
MPYKVTLNLTDEQYRVLTGMAASQFRTLSNLLGMLICEGFSYHAVDTTICVKKPEQGPENPFSFYTDHEIEEVLKSLPFQGES